eukprot:TRINITY_DN11787_c0_g1_i3.p3 TRINITY_DN11787_c0_g1~~TRINITY_DN11787_c0_g1_i3.p3  ORF type:complete len:109 (-),score=14.71 TRINITY_DN11787_c0_g1_i3:211-537(-)
MEYPLVQLVSLTAFTVCTLGMTAYFRPYSLRNEYFSSIAAEVGSLTTLVVSRCLNCVKGLSPGTRNALGEAVVCTMALGTTAMAIGSFYETAKNAIAFIRSIKAHRFN